MRPLAPVRLHSPKRRHWSQSELRARPSLGSVVCWWSAPRLRHTHTPPPLPLLQYCLSAVWHVFGPLLPPPSMPSPWQAVVAGSPSHGSLTRDRVSHYCFTLRSPTSPLPSLSLVILTHPLGSWGTGAHCMSGRMMLLYPRGSNLILH